MPNFCPPPGRPTINGQNSFYLWGFFGKCPHTKTQSVWTFRDSGDEEGPDAYVCRLRLPIMDKTLLITWVSKSSYGLCFQVDIGHIFKTFKILLTDLYHFSVSVFSKNVKILDFPNYHISQTNILLRCCHDVSWFFV